MKLYKLLISQFFIAAVCLALFGQMGRLSDPMHSFVFSFIFYWFMLAVAVVFYLIHNRNIAEKMKVLLGKPRLHWAGLLSFIPVIGVVFAVFLPNLPLLSMEMAMALAAISFINGFLEEVFWRGLALAAAEAEVVMLAVSTLVFGAFHFSFLLLPIKYHGGAQNLVGGALMMGALWMFSARKSQSIFYPIVAHMLANFCAFTGLFLENNFIIR